MNADGLGYTDRVGDLDFAALRDARGDDVFRDEPGVVTSAPIDLARVLSAEGAPAVPAHAAIAVDDDLSPGEPAVALGSSDDEAAGRVHVDLGPLVDELFRKRLVDDELDHRFSQVLVLDLLVVLGADDDGIDANGNVVLVFERHLRLAIGTEKVDGLFLTNRRKLPRECVGVLDGGRHELRRLVRRIAEHEPLVAGALLLVQAVSLVHPLRDIGALTLDRRQHRACGRIEPHGGVHVADVRNGTAHDGRKFNARGRRDLPRDDHHSGLGQRLARDARPRVLRENGVKNRVGHLVTQLVRMSLGDGLGRESIAGHAVSLDGPQLLRFDRIAKLAVASHPVRQRRRVRDVGPGLAREPAFRGGGQVARASVPMARVAGGSNASGP